MEQHIKDFLGASIDTGAMLFGEFTLKSGRISPYFLNTGKFCDGKSLAVLSNGYCALIQKSNVEFDVLFGPAYKGIPLAATTALGLWVLNSKDVGYSHDRKEIKDHGEGGRLVGADIKGKRVALIDDVTTNNATKIEATQMVQREGGEVVAIFLSFDRQERGQDSNLSAVQELKQKLGVPVFAIATLTDLMECMEDCGQHADKLKAIRTYQQKYGN